jgi:CHAT domain-containing protein/tetratricopeptide (TPR) repeat protein
MSRDTDGGIEACRLLLLGTRYQDAKSLIEELVEKGEGAVLQEALILQAECRYKEGDYESAIRSLHESLRIAEERGDEEAQLQALVQSGRIYMTLNRHDLALQSLTRAVPVATTPFGRISLISAVADVYARAGCLTKAEELSDLAILWIQQAEMMADSVVLEQEQRLLAERRLVVVRLAEAQGQYHRMLYFVKWIEDDARRGQDTLALASGAGRAPPSRQVPEALAALTDLFAGRAFMGLMELDEARARLTRARDRASEWGDVAVEVKAAAALGRLALRIGRFEDAIRHLADAAEQADRWLAVLEVEEFRVGLRSGLEEFYGDLVAAAVYSGDDDLVWRSIDRARAREFLASLQTASQPLELGGATFRKLKQLTQRIGALSEELHSPGHGRDSLGRIREERRSLLDEKMRLLGELRRRPSQSRHLEAVDPQPASVDALQRSLGDGTALVEYFFSPLNLSIAVVVADGVVSTIDLGIHPQAIRRRVQRFRTAVGTFPKTSKDDSWRILGLELYNALWAPLTDIVGGRDRVCIVPHSSVLELPFAALCSQERLLIQQTEVVYAPSASILAVLGHGRTRAIERVAVVSNPLPDGSWALPATEREADAILRTGFEFVSLQGRQATPRSVIEAARSVDALHLACHAEFDPERPLLSGLLLANESDEVAKLEAHSIYGIEMAARMVVLSACETGRFESEPASELQGLVRAFMIAGANTVIGSQWIVDDPATAAVMASFYEALAAGEKPGAALRSAELSLASNPRYEHPFYWAPFCLYGDWR